jgi:TonB family protein
LVLLLAGACDQGPYVPDAELERRPYPLAHIDPQYPATAGEAQYFGRIRMNLYISAAGEVDRVEVVEASVPAAFREAAVAAFAASRWEPGRKGGRRVRSLKAIEVRFEPPKAVERPPMRPES